MGLKNRDAGKLQRFQMKCFCDCIADNVRLTSTSLPNWKADLDPAVVAKGRVIRPLVSRFDSDLVIDGDSKLLLTAEVMFGRLDGHVTEQELDLVELTPAK
jgi:hypothetical protein